jgi:hypothetical protein
MAAEPGGEPAAEPQLTPQPQAPAPSESPPDPAIVAEVRRLVEASLEALRDRRDHRHQSFLKESLAKLPDFAPARWHSGFVHMGGEWVHVDQAPYLAGDNPVLRKYVEMRERADRRHYPTATTAEAKRDHFLDRQVTSDLVDDRQTSFRDAVPNVLRNGRVIDIPATVTVRDQTRLVQQMDTYAREHVRITNTAGYSPGYARAQESLARWCAQQGLSEEARVHWAHVFQQEPGNQAAALALGMVKVGNRFVPKQRVERAAQLENDIARSLETWHLKLTKLRQQSLSPDESARQAALAEVRAIEEPNAVFTLERIVLRPLSTSAKRLDYAANFDREVVAVIGKFDTQPATEALVRIAVRHDAEAVRHAAADRLKGREPRTFVPLLLDGLTMPIEYNVQIVENLRGEKQLFAQASQEHDSHIAGLRDTRQVYNGKHLMLLKAAAQNRARQLDAFNRGVRELNARIVAALVRAVEIDRAGPFRDLAMAADLGAADPKRWWDWWYDYNEQYVSGDKPYYGYEYDWSIWNAYDAEYQPSRSVTTRQDWYLPTSCFVKGTPVWTLSGPKPVEQVKVGDRVLAQHPETGELTYKGVLVTTLRPPSEMLAIRAGKGEITTTLGHPFFVVGKGWRMAKELTESDWICAFGQTLPIDTIEKAEPAQAYNLMVADFGTYFVGKDRILVHDNSPIPPVRLEMPGLLAVR